MRLYLSSFRLGNKPEEMLPLIDENKRVAVIANAADMKAAIERPAAVQFEIDKLGELGLNAEELDLRQYFGKPNDLAKTLERFGYIWVIGGNVFLLRRAFNQSGFDTILSDLLRNDKVAYGGYSAGVCILSPSLRGLELVDPPNDITDDYDKEVIWSGLGLLGYSVAPHYQSDHPESEDVNKSVAYFRDNDIPFKTLRDGEAIIVNGNEERVVT